MIWHFDLTRKSEAKPASDFFFIREGMLP